MAINLGFNRNTREDAVVTNTVNALNLQKNDILDLTKKNPGLEKVILGAGWDVASTGQDFDLDIAAFLLDANNKVSRVPADVIFFNNKFGDGIYLECIEKATGTYGRYKDAAKYIDPRKD